MGICQRTAIATCRVEGWRILVFPCAMPLSNRAVCCAILIDSTAELERLSPDRQRAENEAADSVMP